MLAIEIDGFTHDDIQKDIHRQKNLEKLGIHVLRFTDDEVKTNIEGVVSTITKWIKQNATRPYPSQAGTLHKIPRK